MKNIKGECESCEELKGRLDFICSHKLRELDLENKLEIAKEALEHYAKEKLYFPRTLIRLSQERGERLAPIYSDFGDVAQQALKQITA